MRRILIILEYRSQHSAGSSRLRLRCGHFIEGDNVGQ
jgi:hypothetical protein